MKKLLIKSEFILIPFSPLIPAIPEKWTKDELEVLTPPMTEVVPAIPGKWTKDDLVVFENPLDETFTHHPEVPVIPSVLDESFTYHPAIPEAPEVAEVKEWRVIDQTQGPEEELQVWLAGNIFKYPEGYVTEWIDLTAQFEQDKINSESLAYLASTDWLVTRQIETGVPCPEDIKLLRAEARSKIVR